MRAWTVDADDIRVAEDFNEALLHRTPEIEGFLRSTGTTSSSSSAPRASARPCSSRPSASSISRKDGRHACRRGVLLDKPIGDKIFSRELLASSSCPPAVVEDLALGDRARDAEAPRRPGRAQGRRKPPASSPTSSCRASSTTSSGSSISPRASSNGAAADTDGHLVPRLRAVSSPVALFIDGVDEYFNKHVEGRPAIRASPASSRRTSGISRSSASSRSPISCGGSIITSRSSPPCARRPTRASRQR